MLGTAIGWRSAFAVMSALTLVLIVWVLAKVPDYPGQAGHERLPLRRVFTTPGVCPVVGVVITWIAGPQPPLHLRGPVRRAGQGVLDNKQLSSKRSGFRCWRSAVAATAVWVNMKPGGQPLRGSCHRQGAFQLWATGCRKNAQGPLNEAAVDFLSAP